MGGRSKVRQGRCRCPCLTHPLCESRTGQMGMWCVYALPQPFTAGRRAEQSQTLAQLRTLPHQSPPHLTRASRVAQCHRRPACRTCRAACPL